MPELTTDFQSLPEEYQQIIRLAQDTHKITVAPLQLLVGGWSGAVVYLVSVSNNETKRVEHCILKLDRKGKNAKSDEVTRHNTVMSKSTSEFARDHIAELAFDRVEYEGAIAILYRIAGESLLKYRPLANYERQSQRIVRIKGHLLSPSAAAEGHFRQVRKAGSAASRGIRLPLRRFTTKHPPASELGPRPARTRPGRLAGGERNTPQLRVQIRRDGIGGARAPSGRSD